MVEELLGTAVVVAEVEGLPGTVVAEVVVLLGTVAVVEGEHPGTVVVEVVVLLGTVAVVEEPPGTVLAVEPVLGTGLEPDLGTVDLVVVAGTVPAEGEEVGPGTVPEVPGVVGTAGDLHQGELCAGLVLLSGGDREF